MAIRHANKGALDNDHWAAADHFFNAWNTQDALRDIFGTNFVSRWLGGIGGEGWNAIYVGGKRIGAPVPQDNSVPPSPATMQQWSWGNQGAWSSVYYPTNMRPGSPEWKSFIAWMESMY
jgi:hypothetical protein